MKQVIGTTTPLPRMNDILAITYVLKNIHAAVFKPANLDVGEADISHLRGDIKCRISEVVATLTRLCKRQLELRGQIPYLPLSGYKNKFL
jgi:hypothetical protein